MPHPDKPLNPLPVQRLASNGHSPVHAAAPPAAAAPPGAESPPAGPPALSAPPSAGALWCAVRRRWLLAVSAGILGALLVVLAVMQVVPGRYSADALIEVNPPNVISDLGETTQDLKTFRENQQAILKSSPV